MYSLPVLNQQDQMIGLVDILDIVRELILQCFKDGKYEEEKTKKFLETQVDALFLLRMYWFLVSSIRLNNYSLLFRIRKRLVQIIHCFQRCSYLDSYSKYGIFKERPLCHRG